MATTTPTEAPVTLVTLLEALDRIAPLIEEDRDQAEQDKRLTQRVVDALKQEGFFRLYVPRSLGGLEIDPVTFLLVIERISRIDAAAAWVVANGVAISSIPMYLPESGARAIFKDPDSLFCGSLNSVGKAVSVDGGYRFTSKSPFNSGCRFSDWCLMQGQVQREGDEGEAPELIALFCPMDRAEVLENWDVLGMGGTASDDVRVEDLFVPTEMTFPMSALGTLPTSQYYTGDLYKMPICHQPMLGTAATLGALRAGLDFVSDLAQNKTPYSTTAKLRERSIAQVSYGKALGSYRAASALMKTSMSNVWSRIQAGGGRSEDDKVELYLAATEGMELIVQGIRQASSVAASNAFRKGSILERASRDIETLRHHAYMCESRFGTVSQALWGLEPDFPYIKV